MNGPELSKSGPWIAVAGLVVYAFMALTAPLVFAPWWGGLLLVGLLIPQIWLVIRWAPTRPAWTTFVPIVGVLAYFVISNIGAVYWNWGA